MRFVILGHAAGVLHTGIDVGSQELLPVMLQEVLARTVVPPEFEPSQVVDGPFVQVGGFDKRDVDPQVSVDRGALDAEHDTEGYCGPGWVFGATIEAHSVLLFQGQLLEDLGGHVFGAVNLARVVAHGW